MSLLHAQGSKATCTWQHVPQQAGCPSGLPCRQPLHINPACRSVNAVLRAVHLYLPVKETAKHDLLLQSHCSFIVMFFPHL